MQIEKSLAQEKIQSQRGLNNGSQNLLELIYALQQCDQKNQGLFFLEHFTFSFYNYLFLGANRLEISF